MNSQEPIEDTLEEIMVHLMRIHHDNGSLSKTLKPDYYYTDMIRTMSCIQRKMISGTIEYIGLRESGVDSSFDFYTQRKPTEYYARFSIEKLDEDLYRLDKETEDTECKPCDFCGESCPSGALFDTDCGMICSYCLRGIESRGEKITIYQRGS